MTRFYKIVIRIFFVFLIIIPMAAFAHFIIFPQETRSILIDYSNFRREDRVYFDPSTEQNKIDSLKSLIQQASVRVSIFWDGKRCNPKFIYCDKEDDFRKFCVSPMAPAVTYLKLGSCIVLSNSAVDLDIIAHEISHAELYERIGFWKFTFTIPSWFKHGLAMQNDDRSYYSEDTLKAKSDNFNNMPPVKNYKTDVQFYEGSREQVMLNYMTAKHKIKNWYTKKKLDKLIHDLNEGTSFEDAFGK